MSKPVIELAVDDRIDPFGDGYEAITAVDTDGSDQDYREVELASGRRAQLARWEVVPKQVPTEE